jgi:hypothetical protein
MQEKVFTAGSGVLNPNESKLLIAFTAVLDLSESGATNFWISVCFFLFRLMSDDHRAIINSDPIDFQPLAAGD